MVPSDFSGIFGYSQPLEIENLLFMSLLRETFLGTFNDSLTKSVTSIFPQLKTHGVFLITAAKAFSTYGEAFAFNVQKDPI